MSSPLANSIAITVHLHQQPPKMSAKSFFALNATGHNRQRSIPPAQQANKKQKLSAPIGYWPCCYCCCYCCWSKLLPQLLLLLLLSFFAQVDNAGAICENLEGNPLGEMHPTVAQAPVGGEIRFTCQIYQRAIDESMLKFDNVFFEHHATRLHPGERVSITHNYPNKSVELTIQPVELADQGRYYCKASQHDIVCPTAAVIKYAHLNVTDFRCVYIFAEHLNCTWTHPSDAFAAEYTMEEIRELELYRKSCPCKYRSRDCAYNSDARSGRHNCRWTNTKQHWTNEPFKISLVATNHYGSNGQNFSIPYRSIIQLQSPRTLRYSNVTKNVTWNNHYVPKSASVLYHQWMTRVTVRQHNQIVHTIDLEFEENTTALDMLLPYRSYNVSVSSKDKLPENVHWSKLKFGSNEIEIHTPVELPSHPPNTTAESFDYVLGLLNKRSVRIYWVELAADDQNGPNFNYTIDYKSLSEQTFTRFDTQAANAHFTDLKCDEIYEFRICSQNAAGRSARSFVFWLERHSSILPRIEKVGVVKNGSSYAILWQGYEFEDTSYRIFWCRSIEARCHGSIHWEAVRVAGQDRKNLRHRLWLPPGADYQFGVSARRKSLVSGIEWAQPECRLDLHFIKWKFFRIEITRITHTSVTIKLPDVCVSYRSIISHFEAVYCVDNTTECRRRSQDDAADNQIVISGLRPWTLYRLNVHAASLDQKDVIFKGIEEVFATDNHDDHSQVLWIKENAPANYTVEMKTIDDDFIAYYRVTFEQQSFNCTKDACQKLRDIRKSAKVGGGGGGYVARRARREESDDQGVLICQCLAYFASKPDIGRINLLACPAEGACWRASSFIKTDYDSLAWKLMLIPCALLFIFIIMVVVYFRIRHVKKMKRDFKNFHIPVLATQMTLHDHEINELLNAELEELTDFIHMSDGYGRRSNSNSSTFGDRERFSASGTTMSSGNSRSGSSPSAEETLLLHPNIPNGKRPVMCENQEYYELQEIQARLGALPPIPTAPKPTGNGKAASNGYVMPNDVRPPPTPPPPALPPTRSAYVPITALQLRAPSPPPRPPQTENPYQPNTMIQNPTSPVE